MDVADGDHLGEVRADGIERGGFALGRRLAVLTGCEPCPLHQVDERGGQVVGHLDGHGEGEPAGVVTGGVGDHGVDAARIYPDDEGAGGIGEAAEAARHEQGGVGEVLVEAIDQALALDHEVGLDRLGGIDVGHGSSVWGRALGRWGAGARRTYCARSAGPDVTGHP